MTKVINIDKGFVFYEDEKCPRGLSGRHFIVEDSRANKRYYFKPDSRLTGINDRLTQLILSDIGLNSINTEWAKSNGTVFVVTEYVEGLKRLAESDICLLTEQGKEDVASFILVNYLFDNSDKFELFIDSLKNVYMLDLSDTILDEASLKLLNVKSNYETVSWFKNHLIETIKERFGSGVMYKIAKKLKQELSEEVILNVLEKIGQIEIENYNAFFSDLSEFFGDDISKVYRVFLESFIKSAEIVNDFYYSPKDDN